MAPNATGWRIAQILVNNTAVASDERAGSADFTTTLYANTEVDLDATDYITVKLYQNSGGDLDLFGFAAAQERSYLIVRKVR